MTILRFHPSLARAALSLAPLAAFACSNIPVTVEHVEPGSTFAMAYASAVTNHELSWYTRSRLYGYGLEIRGHENPAALFERFGDQLRTAGAWEDQLALAEILCLAARQSAPTEATKYYLDAAIEAGTALLREDGPHPFDPRMQVLLGIHDVTLGEVFTNYQYRLGHPAGWTELEGVARSYPVQYRSDWAVGQFSRFAVADELRFTGIGPRHRAFGIGTPLVAVSTSSDRSYYPSRGMTVPATLVLHRDPAHREQLVLRIEDPLAKPTIDVAGRTVPLAADFSAAVASFVAGVDTSSYDNTGFFHPGASAAPSGIRVLQPYDPHKIPVVFVHGLWSDPVIWRFAVNAIIGDPVLRQRCQVWAYLYSTGEPLLTSTARFRRELDNVRQHFDPEGDDPATQDIVVIGHSLGGLLTSTTIRSSGTKLWSTVFKVPAADYQAQIEKDDVLRRLMFFDPKPYVNRVVFLSTPHRGSWISDSFIGGLGNMLISPSGVDRQEFERLQKNYAGILRDDYEVEETSVAMLSPSNSVLLAISGLPIRRGVNYHSVIGQEEPGPKEEGTDGVVPYSSSHLEGAQSELIIRSEHSTEMQPPAIAEIVRILRLHVEEKGLD